MPLTADTLLVQYNKYMKIFLFLLLILAQLGLQAADKLVIIQSVSQSGQTFAIRSGAREGITWGQESLFSTESSAFKARAYEVTRFYSVWKIHDPRGSVPFRKGDYVVFTGSIELAGIRDAGQIQGQSLEQISFMNSGKKSTWMVRGNLTSGISESVTETDAERSGERSGLQFGIFYVFKFHYRWELDLGLRYDRELVSYTDPLIDVLTNRYLGVAEMQFHFDRMRNSQKNIFIALGMTYGRSASTIDEFISTGTAYSLPIARIGIQQNKEGLKAWTFDLAVEAMHVTESFSDTEPQDTTLINGKFAIAYKF